MDLNALEGSRPIWVTKGQLARYLAAETPLIARLCERERMRSEIRWRFSKFDEDPSGILDIIDARRRYFSRRDPDNWRVVQIDAVTFFWAYNLQVEADPTEVSDPLTDHAWYTQLEAARQFETNRKRLWRLAKEQTFDQGYCAYLGGRRPRYSSAALGRIFL